MAKKGKKKNKAKAKEEVKAEEQSPEGDDALGDLFDEGEDDSGGALDELFDDAPEEGGALDDLFDDEPEEGGALEELFEDPSEDGDAAKPLAPTKEGVRVREEPKPEEPEEELDPEALEERAAANIREIFGVSEDGKDKLDDIDDYAPDVDVEVGIPTGKLVIVLFVTGLLVALFFIARYAVEKREAEIADLERERELEEQLAMEPSVRYGHLAILASTPAKAIILKNDEPIYAQTPSGAYTELRAGHNTKVQNLEIQGQIRFMLTSEGYKNYDLIIEELDWVPSQQSDDYEKVIHNVRLEPDDRNLYSSIPTQAVREQIQKVEGLEGFKIIDEIQTRGAFERMYDAKLGGELVVEARHAETSASANATIFFLGKPLLKGGEGTPATTGATPYKFSYYAPKDTDGDGNADAYEAFNPKSEEDLKALPETAKPVSVTSELTVRLEEEGRHGYITNIYPHQWHCEPIKDAERLADIKQPEALDKNPVPLFHHYCDYSITVKGRMYPPKKQQDETEDGADDPADGQGTN